MSNLGENFGLLVRERPIRPINDPIFFLLNQCMNFNSLNANANGNGHSVGILGLNANVN
jgi:hypothetical protein